MRRFQDLIVWQKAHQVVLSVYHATKQFPKEELYGLVAQMRRAAISVPANLAEGHKRKGKREFVNFVTIAEGSLEELKYYLILSQDLEYLPTDAVERLSVKADEIGRMLHGLKSHIRREIYENATAVR